MRRPVVWLLAVALGIAQDPGDGFEVIPMLQAALEGASNAQGAEKCLTEDVQANWRREMDSAAEMMLQKTQRTMQQGLDRLGRATVDLLEAGGACGEPAALERLKAQAARLSVFATSKGLLHLGGRSSKVVYEPLKALNVGGADVHLELNALLVAWQLRKGPEEVGAALRLFLQDFRDEAEQAATPSQQASPPERIAPADDPHGRQTPHFWAEALNAAFPQLGDSVTHVDQDCLSDGAVQALSVGVEVAFESMFEKTRRSMQIGLKGLATSILAFLEDSGCRSLLGASGAQRLQAAANRLMVFATAKTLVNFGVHVEYEAMKTLKVGGVDVHNEVNQFIGAWRLNHEPKVVGIALAKFFQDFAEEGLATKGPSETAADELPMMRVVLQDAFAVGGSQAPAAGCFTDEVVASFEQGVDAAIDHMLKKRKRSMQQGLKELADATDALLRSAGSPECTSNDGVVPIWQAARKLQRLTRRSVVDYGTHIKYEAMKSLLVGGVAIHVEINAFIAAWKLGNRRESGRPFGQLMAKCATISGHDEM